MDKKYLDEPLIKGFLKLIEVFESHRVQYCLIGGMAVSVWSVSRYTKDADFTVIGENHSFTKLLDYLKQNGFSCEEKSTSQLVINNLKLDTFRIDIILSETEYQDILVKRSIVKKIPEINEEIRVCTPEDLVILKMIARRRIDYADIEGVLKFNWENLDLEYMKKWFQFWELQSYFKEEFEKDFPQLSSLWS